jgi:hypothetical protein
MLEVDTQFEVMNISELFTVRERCLSTKIFRAILEQIVLLSLTTPSSPLIPPLPTTLSCHPHPLLTPSISLPHPHPRSYYHPHPPFLLHHLSYQISHHSPQTFSPYFDFSISQILDCNPESTKREKRKEKGMYSHSEKLRNVLRNSEKTFGRQKINDGNGIKTK